MDHALNDEDKEWMRAQVRKDYHHSLPALFAEIGADLDTVCVLRYKMEECQEYTVSDNACANVQPLNPFICPVTTGRALHNL